MTQPLRVGQTYFPSKPSGAPKQPSASVPVNKPFEHYLKGQLTTGVNTPSPNISFSQHALGRLKDRGIELTEADLTRLENAVQRAAAKGSKESLILMDHVAYVVNVANRKVITAVDEGHMKDNVFTNIDSAVLV